jgi:hypothetical protein
MPKTRTRRRPRCDWMPLATAIARIIAAVIEMLSK